MITSTMPFDLMPSSYRQLDYVGGLLKNSW